MTYGRVSGNDSRTAPGTGFFTLASDGVLEWFIALAESLRAVEPDRPWIILPLDGRVDQIAGLAGRYGFTVFDDPVLDELEGLGRRLWSDRPLMAPFMRKLAAFYGPVEQFMFLDSDIVVLEGLQPYFDAMVQSQADLLFLHADRDQVYRSGDLRNRMIEDHGSPGFNTGAFVSRRGAIPRLHVEAMVDEAVSIEDQFVAGNLEQPFINYCADRGGLNLVAADSAVEQMAAAWAGMWLQRRRDQWLLADRREPARGRPVSLIHWAGYRLTPVMPYRRAFLEARVPESISDRRRYLVRWIARFLSNPRESARLLRDAPSRTRNWLAARRGADERALRF